ncbi:uncharacterized protein Tco025E_06645 [Trypanosoma conorhini]|uniref:C2HC/C3H-type domain-containing protein n=1 Tax=Trypanosoma conorhini TaxID=83891 RepID=A0A3R7N320_9TRYP|nr:uncharacterized protein Tco025E_06645 [Trypanosoma conorhini]RNF12041.1 hypothetical protein Tco025E_06645 [Trypanosoma conorhini]
MHHAAQDAAAAQAVQGGGGAAFAGAGANGAAGGVGWPWSPAAGDLLREQMAFLANAQANDIRASLFLRLRLSAQQRRTAQRNQLAERRAAQNRRRSTSVPAGAAAAASAAAAEEEEEACDDGWRCPGCSRRYTDAAAYTRHRSNCRRYNLLLRRQGGETVPPSARSVQAATTTSPPPLTSSTFRSELELTQRRLEPAASTSPRATAATARCTPSTANAPGAPPAEQSQRRAAAGGNAAAPLQPSALAESPSTNHSLSIPCSSVLDERREECVEREDRREFARNFSLSRELTPSSFGPQSQHKMSPSARNSIDELPAAVADRVSFDRSSPLPVWLSLGNTVKSREDGEGGAGVAQPTLSCRQSSVACNSTAVSGLNWGEAAEGAEEPLRPCPYCGRSFFAESRWPRHVAVCEQQQQQQQQRKRNSRTSVARGTPGNRSHRASRASTGGSLDSSSVLRDTAQPLASSRGKSGDAKGSAAGKPAAKWRQQSAHLRQSLQLPGTSAQTVLPDSVGDMDVFEDGRVGCPSCGRRFAPAAAERHIPSCRERGSGQKKMRI